MYRGSLLQISCYQDWVGDLPLRDCRFDLLPVDLNSLGDEEIANIKIKGALAPFIS